MSVNCITDDVKAVIGAESEASHAEQSSEVRRSPHATMDQAPRDRDEDWAPAQARDGDRMSRARRWIGSSLLPVALVLAAVAPEAGVQGAKKVRLVFTATPTNTSQYLWAALFMLYTPRSAGFWAIATCLGVYFGFRVLYDRDLPLGGRARDGWRHVVEGCRDGAGTATVIGVLVAGSQIMVDVIGLALAAITLALPRFVRGELLGPRAALEASGPSDGREKG